MRVLVVLAHPVAGELRACRPAAARWPASTGPATRCASSTSTGIGFDPVMSAEDRRDYHTPDVNEATVADHLDQLRWAEGLVFVYPTWWYSMPAMLKGWIDRVWVPHATFELPKGLAPIQGRLHNIRLIGGFSTYGSPWWWIRFVVATRAAASSCAACGPCAIPLPDLLARPLPHGQLDPAEPRALPRPGRGAGGAALTKHGAHRCGLRAAEGGPAA